jgi:DNA helicase IV
MQLLMISRRAVDGSLTMLGDVAQATGPVVYGAWEELEPYLPEDVAVTIEELKHAYRVPAEIMELALPLLDTIAPDMARPLAYRRGGLSPKFLEVPEADLLPAALHEAAELDGLLAVIAPRSLAAAAPQGEAFDELSVPILTPRQAKGLEFDHVVVVEPALIAEEGGDSGLRELYVALTRPTKSLAVVYSRPLPM